MKPMTLIFGNLIISGLVFHLVFTPTLSVALVSRNCNFKMAPFFWITLYIYIYKKEGIELSFILIRVFFNVDNYTGCPIKEEAF